MSEASRTSVAIQPQSRTIGDVTTDANGPSSSFSRRQAACRERSDASETSITGGWSEPWWSPPASRWRRRPIARPRAERLAILGYIDDGSNLASALFNMQLDAFAAQRSRPTQVIILEPRPA